MACIPERHAVRRLEYFGLEVTSIPMIPGPRYHSSVALLSYPVRCIVCLRRIRSFILISTGRSFHVYCFWMIHAEPPYPQILKKKHKQTNIPLLKTKNKNTPSYSHTVIQLIIFLKIIIYIYQTINVFCSCMTVFFFCMTV